MGNRYAEAEKLNGSFGSLFRGACLVAYSNNTGPPQADATFVSRQLNKASGFEDLAPVDSKPCRCFSGCQKTRKILDARSPAKMMLDAKKEPGAYRFTIHAFEAENARDFIAKCLHWERCGKYPSVFMQIVAIYCR